MTGSRQNCQFHRILIGYDGSEQSERALEAGLTIAGTCDSKVQILSVVRPPEPMKSLDTGVVIEHARKRCEQALRRISEAANGNGIQLTTNLAVGHPAEQILQHAEEIRADLIIVGQRGASNFAGISLGSVSERVMAYATCPVLVTR